MLTIAAILALVVLPLGTCAVTNVLSETTLVILSVFDIVFLMYVLRAFIRAHAS